MLVHQLSSGFWGNYGQISDAKENLDQLMKKIKEIYKRYTKIPTKKIDEILARDLWWDAKTCLKFGLVDEIL
jgi:ATP-dependent protease ClpP protease subunit